MNSKILVLGICWLVTSVTASSGQVVQTLQPKEGLDRTTARAYGATERYHSVCWSPMGNAIAAATQDRVSIWETNEFKELASVPCSIPQNRWMSGLAFSGDGKLLVFADGDTRQVRVISVDVGEVVCSIPTDKLYVSGVAINHDGQLVALASKRPGKVSVHSGRDGKRLVTFDAFSNFMTTLDYVGETTLLACGGKDNDEGPTVRVFDASSGEQVAASRWQQQAVYGLSCSRNGKRLVSTSGDGTTKVFDMETNGHLRLDATLPTSDRYRVSISADGTTTATADNQLHICDTDTRELRAAFPYPEITSLSLAPDGKRLAVTSKRGSPFPVILEVAKLEVARLPVKEIRVSKSGSVGGDRSVSNLLRFNKNGTRLAFADDHDAIRLLSVPDSRIVASLESENELSNWHVGYSTALTPDSSIIFELDEILMQWSADTGRTIRLQRLPPDSRLKKISWCPPDNLVLQMLHKDSTYEILVLSSDGQLRKRHSIGRNGGNAAAVSPDGRLLAYDDIVFDLKQETQLGKFGFRSQKQLAFSPDSRYLVSQKGRL